MLDDSNRPFPNCIWSLVFTSHLDLFCWYTSHFSKLKNSLHNHPNSYRKYNYSIIKLHSKWYLCLKDTLWKHDWTDCRKKEEIYHSFSMSQIAQVWHVTFDCNKYQDSQIAKRLHKYEKGEIHLYHGRCITRII